jgi:hypothetical protein
MCIFPAEIIHEILQYYRPYTTSPIIGEDAAWRNSNRGAVISNWWSGKLHDSGYNESQLKPYKNIFPLRL